GFNNWAVWIYSAAKRRDGVRYLQDSLTICTAVTVRLPCSALFLFTVVFASSFMLCIVELETTPVMVGRAGPWRFRGLLLSRGQTGTLLPRGPPLVAMT